MAAHEQKQKSSSHEPDYEGDWLDLHGVSPSGNDQGYIHSIDRYQNIPVHDDYQVQLLKERTYVNASWVMPSDSCHPQVQLIAGQAPLPNGMGDFLHYIATSRVPAILMLTPLVESGKSKADDYFSESGAYPIHMDPTFKVHVTMLHRVDVTDALSLRTLQLSVVRDGVELYTHQVQHIHYNDWPDHNAPKCLETVRTVMSLSKMMALAKPGGFLNVAFSKVHETARAPFNFETSIFVHCSAGVGRTAVFATMFYLGELYAHQGFVSYQDLLTQMKRIRECRTSFSKKHLPMLDSMRRILFPDTTSEF